MKEEPNLPAGLKKLWALNWKRKWLLIEALAVLSAYRGLLYAVPFSAFVRPGPVLAPAPTPAISKDRLNAVVWAITVVSRPGFLGFTCLVQALATKWLLKNTCTTQLCMGVCKPATAGFLAHAWLTCGGKVVLGKQAAPVFEPILEWQ